VPKYKPYEKPLEWKKQIDDMRRVLGVGDEFNPWTELGLGEDITNPRDRGTMNIAWISRMKAQPGTLFQEAVRDFFVDVSQMPARTPWGSLMTLCGGISSFYILYSGTVHAFLFSLYVLY
jgi:hypothetical protein